MCRVLEHEKAVSIRKCSEGVHVARMPVEVDRHDRLGPRADPGRRRVRVEIQRVGVHVREDRRCPDVDQYVGRSREGKWGRDHLVSRSNPQAYEGQMQCGRAGADRQSVRDIEHVPERRLQPVGPRSHRDPPGPECIRHLRLFFRPETRLMEGKKCLADGRPPADRERPRIAHRWNSCFSWLATTGLLPIWACFSGRR